jgi:MOSC domain-containing protein YiiM
MPVGEAVDGRVEAIFVGAVAQAPLDSVDAAKAVAGSGLEGDRYAVRAGSFSKKEAAGREVTLIESEAIAAARSDYGVDLSPGDPRRNVVTSGVALNHLVGREFSVGEVRLRGVRLCEPCEHLEKVSGLAGIRKALVHRGGLRAEIVENGTVRVGDPVRS